MFLHRGQNFILPEVKRETQQAVSLWGFFFAVIAILVVCSPLSVFAHPMGNFSINHFSALEVHPTLIRVFYIIDMAEIPTFQEMQDYRLNVQPDDPVVIAYREQKVQALRQGLRLKVAEQVLPLVTRASTLTFPPGAGGLPTLRISAVYEAQLEVLDGQVVYEDHNYPQRIGWKELMATAHDGVLLSTSSVPAESQSHQLTNYATDLVQAPPQDLQANLAFSVPAATRTRALESPAIANDLVPTRTEAQTPRNMLTELMTSRQLSSGVILFSLLVAAGLGAFHALEPGHGKTLVAAYLVGSQGTPWHAVVLGLAVTASHTVGVYALGGIALFASHYVLPEQLYPWLGFTSGLLIMGTGLVLFTRARREHNGHEKYAHHGHTHSHYGYPHDHVFVRPYDHDHGHDHNHIHLYKPHPYAYEHVHGGHTEQIGYGTLLTLGITGGMVPCPAALVVLLSAVALQRIAFGLLLIVAFSVGLAVVLVGAGLLVVSAREAIQRWSGEGPWLAYLPFLAPLVITPLGLVIVVRSLMGS